ncbi:DUF3562 domain-containing protein [Paraburkholderia sp. 1N]|uniref:DUF3562 domain-containing protein n=1 Tax=Paraburkholderia solitsugae TaxID=2675748 RepID=A0ABX2BR88_9BURK|nr:DUF3562 domain-containing protein [Paraburkholderia solitsugae]NPT42446.1 DUF3562 domain-containing protein [Paraburkholderia solitsugae]
MPRDKLLVPLLEIAQGTALSEDDLARMVGDEISRLSAGARVHDYIQVIAIKRVSDKVRQSASHHRANGNHHAREV